MPNVSLSPLYSSIDSTFGTQRKLCRRAQRRRFIFQLYMFPEALHPTQEQLWVLITSGCRLRSPAIKDVTHNNPHGSFLFNFFFFFALTYENRSDNKQHNVLTMDVRVTLQLCTSLNKAGIQNIHEHFRFPPLTCCQLKVHREDISEFPHQTAD